MAHKAVLKFERNCKHSVVYKPVDDESKFILTSFYVSHPVVEALGRPDQIEITIEKKKEQERN